MNQTPQIFHLENTPSDILVSARGLLKAYPELRELFLEPYQLSLVLDANIVLSDLIWLAKHRKNPIARTRLQEVLSNQTIIAHAPLYLEIEVRRHIERIAGEEGIDVLTLEEEWAEYRKLIQFRDDPPIPEALKSESVDPDDLPYSVLATSERLPVLSRDLHLEQMATTVLPSSIVPCVQEYSRQAAVEFAFTSAHAIITGIGLTSIVGLFKVMVSSISTFRRLPRWVIVLFAVVLIIAVTNRSSRESILTKLRSTRTRSKNFLLEVLSVLKRILVGRIEAAKNTERALEVVKEQILFRDSSP